MPKFLAISSAYVNLPEPTGPTINILGGLLLEVFLYRISSMRTKSCITSPDDLSIELNSVKKFAKISLTPAKFNLNS